MHYHRTRQVILVGSGLITLTLILLSVQRILVGQATAAASYQTSSTPVIGRQIILYDPALNTGDLSTQAFTYSALLAPNATTSFDMTQGVTVLETTAAESESAGYGIIGDVTLDRTQGYTLRFMAQVVSEAHSSDDRAGFSVIALSSDKNGIEVGFWEDEVWAQEGGSGSGLFTHAEGAALDTTGSQADGQTSPLTQYELRVLGDAYSIAASPVPLSNRQVRASYVLSGTVRDYTAFSGFPDVYETPNLLFFGDDTSRAQAEVKIGMISAIVAEPPASRIITAGVTIDIDDLGLIVETTAEFTVTFTADSGTLAIDTTIPGGVVPQSVTAGPNPVIFADANAINTTLAHPGGLTYQSLAAFSGTDTIAILVDVGGETAQQAIQVTVLSPSAPTATTTATPVPNATPAPTLTMSPGSAEMPPPGPIYLPFVAK